MLADAVISALTRIKNKRPYLQDIQHSLFVEHRLFCLDVHDLSDELRMESDLQSMENLALDNSREFFYKGSVDQLASNGGQLRQRKLVDISAGNNADIVHRFHERRRRDVDRVGFALHDAFIRIRC